ncbi:hypothetical protein RsTz2092_13710 [Deferribacterales bacterium RsTz2092]|nr:hypothetical protein AGMMS49941_12980 [Deferribacterales bacterium]
MSVWTTNRTRFHKLATQLTADPDTLTGNFLRSHGIIDHGQFIPENSVNIAMCTTTNDKFNIIPDNAKLKVEVRCYEMSEQKRIDEEIREICKTPTLKHAKISVEGGINKPSMEKDARAAKLFELYKDAVRTAYNADATEWTAGGLTVANITSEYKPTIDALGVDIDPELEHSIKEAVDVSTFVPRTVALVLMLGKVDEVLQ